MKILFMYIFQIILFIQVLNTSAHPFPQYISDDSDLTEGSGNYESTTIKVTTSKPTTRSIPDWNVDPTQATKTTIKIPDPPITPESTISPKTTKSTDTTTKEIQTASILEKYYNWFNNLLGKNFQGYQIILISVAIILAPILIIIFLICVIRRCCCKKEPEYDGPASSFYGGASGYGSIGIAKQSKRVNRRDSGKSMTRGDYQESEIILQTTMDRNKSRKNREMKEQIAREFED